MYIDRSVGLALVLKKKFCGEMLKGLVLSNCVILQMPRLSMIDIFAICLWHRSKVLRRVSPTSDKSPPQDRSSQVYDRHPCLSFQRTSSPRLSSKSGGIHPCPLGPNLLLVWWTCGIPWTLCGPWLPNPPYLSQPPHGNQAEQRRLTSRDLVDQMLECRSLLGSPPPEAFVFSAATCPKLRWQHVLWLQHLNMVRESRRCPDLPHQWS